MIIDDKTFYRKKLRRILEQSGHHVVGETGNFKSALSLFKMFRPDLVTIEIEMRDTIGYTCLESIQNECDKTKVIVISGTSNEKHVIKSLNRGAQHYILKSNRDLYIKDKVNCILTS